MLEKKLNSGPRFHNMLSIIPFCLLLLGIHFNMYFQITVCCQPRSPCTETALSKQPLGVEVKFFWEVLRWKSFFATFTLNIFDDNIRSTEVTVLTSSISVSSSRNRPERHCNDQKVRNWWKWSVSGALISWHSAQQIDLDRGSDVHLKTKSLQGKTNKKQT